MVWRNDTMMNPSIEELLGRVDSKFTLVTLASRRARQVNAYFNQLGEGLGAIVPPQIASTARKPLSIAFEEIAADKITYERIREVTGDELTGDEGTGDEDSGEEAQESEPTLGAVDTLSDTSGEGADEPADVVSTDDTDAGTDGPGA